MQDLTEILSTIPQISARMGIKNRFSGHIFNTVFPVVTRQDAGNKGLTTSKPTSRHISKLHKTGLISWRASALMRFYSTLKRGENMCKFNKSDFEQQVKQLRDDDDNRYVKCESCGNIVSTDDCVSYGGINRVNLGKCRDCVYRFKRG